MFWTTFTMVLKAWYIVMLVNTREGTLYPHKECSWFISLLLSIQYHCLSRTFSHLLNHISPIQLSLARFLTLRYGISQSDQRKCLRDLYSKFGQDSNDMTPSTTITLQQQNNTNHTRYLGPISDSLELLPKRSTPNSKILLNKQP